MRKPFVANTRSRRIHDVRRVGEKCNIDDAKDDHLLELGTSGVEVRLRSATEHWNLCDWCWANEEE